MTTTLAIRLPAAQAAVLNLPHLTNDRRRLAAWPDMDFLVPER
jgi:hypothetical protein